MKAVGELRAGRMVLLAGDAGGDLVMAAGCVTPAGVNFMAKEGRGLIRLALTPERCDELALPMQVTRRSDASDAFTVSIEARDGVSTGISAGDRARTIRVAVDPATTAADLVRPGHIFPLRTAAGGVLERPGRAEAAVALARLAGVGPSGVLCEVLDEDGAVAGPATLEAFAARHDLTLVTTADVLAYVGSAVTRDADGAEPIVRTTGGQFTAVAYRAVGSGVRHVALVKGSVAGRSDLPVHVHRECYASTVPGSTTCTCRARLRQSLAAVEAAGAGVVIQIRGEDGALDDHAPPRSSDLAIAARILEDLGLEPACVRAPGFGSAAA